MASLAPPQGGELVNKPTSSTETDEFAISQVFIWLRWFSGELNQWTKSSETQPFDTLKNFIEYLDDGRCPGVPALWERAEEGRYKLLWGTRLLDEEKDGFHMDIGLADDDELTLIFVRDEPPASSRVPCKRTERP